MNGKTKVTEVQKVKLDFDKLDKVLKERKMSRRELASRTGHHATYFSDLKKIEGSIPIGMEGFICSELGVEKGTLIRKEQPAEQIKGNVAEIAILENIYKEIQEVKKLLGEVGEQGEAIWNKLNTNTIQLMKIKEKVSELGISDYEKAVKFLRDTLAGGPVLGEEVLLKCEAAGIKRADINKAKNELGIRSTTKGYGKGAKVWWYIEN